MGKLLGREHATRGGVGCATVTLGDGTVVAAIAVANAFGDVIGEDGELLGAPRGEDGRLVRAAELLPGMPTLPESRDIGERTVGNTTLVCVCTDASVDKRTCAIVARMASAGIARAVDPTFTPLDGDVVFCLASGSEPPPSARARRLLDGHRARDGCRHRDRRGDPRRGPPICLNSLRHFRR